jgi:hypothetical protein
MLSWPWLEHCPKVFIRSSWPTGASGERVSSAGSSQHSLDYVVRIKKGSCLIEEDGHRWKLGQEGLKPGQLRFCEGVRYGLYHDRPRRDLWINVALCFRMPKSKMRDPRRKVPAEPWYLATSLKDPKSAASWYWQRGWIELVFQRFEKPLWSGKRAGWLS